MTTLRDVVLDAMVRLERRHGRDTFAAADIIQEALAEEPDLLESSLRTHIVSVMCRNAPVHHANHTDDLERASRGMYRRITDAPSGAGRREPPAATSMPPPDGDDRQELPESLVRPWHWEGHVQERFVQHLKAEGWSIHSAADTATRQQGVDVLAERGGELLVAEVKGFPTTTYSRGWTVGQRKPTNPNTQAPMWIAPPPLSPLRSGRSALCRFSGAPAVTCGMMGQWRR